MPTASGQLRETPKSSPRNEGLLEILARYQLTVAEKDAMLRAKRCEQRGHGESALEGKEMFLLQPGQEGG